MRGKKSTNIQKRLAGTDRVDRLDPEVNVPILDKLPPAPEYLNAQAKKIYESSLSKALLKKGVINEFTLFTWVTGCQLIGIWIDFSMKRKIARSMAKDFSQYRIAKDARIDALAIFREFGLTPLSIARIMHFTDDSQKDEYERYLSK